MVLSQDYSDASDLSIAASGVVTGVPQSMREI